MSEGSASLSLSRLSLQSKNNQRIYEVLITVFLFVFIIAIIKHIPGHLNDNKCWYLWGSYIHEHGLIKAYHSGTNYLPVYQYIMYVFGLLAGSTEAFVRNVSYLRLLTLAFDVLGLYFIYRWIDKRTSIFILILFNILNIAWSYNTIIWGQVDGISASFVFASLYYAYDKKFVLSSIWMILAINMKMQAVIFLPVYGLLFAAHMLQSWNWKGLIASIFATGAAQLILLFPFMLDDKAIPSPVHVMNTYTSTYPVVSMNAFNFWYWVLPGDPFTTSDEGVAFMGLPLKRIGLILFFIASFFTLWPMLRMALKAFREKEWIKVLIPRQQLWLICAQIALLFFFLNTQMHERYCHPAFIFLTTYAFYTKDFIPYALFSLAYLLNLEKVLQSLQLDSYDALIFNPSFIAVLYGLTIAYLFFRIYRPYVIKDGEIKSDEASLKTDKVIA